MSTTATRPFSTMWMVLSVFIFIGVELFLGGFVGEVLCGRFVSAMLLLRLQVILSLAGYFIGGFLIGLFSPGIRMLEPAIGASVSVALTLIFAIFMPVSFLQVTSGKLLMGGAIAFLLALLGAYFGERLAGNVR